MGKIFSKLPAFALAAALLLSLAGCGSSVSYEVASYQGLPAQGQSISDFNPELFYRNQKYTNSCDPFVLDNTARDGYYYIYGTEGSCYCYRSRDLMNWEPVGNALDNLSYEADGSYSETRKVTWDAIYAPEVIYDEQTELYYMFFSANPKPDTAVQGVEKGDTWFNILVATSKYPYKDFQLVDFTDPDSCGQENVRTLNTASYPQYYAKYALLDPEALWAFCNAGEEKGYDGYGGYVPVIDPHPFVDDNGDKYLYWVDMLGTNRMCVVKMHNWLTPDWSTATMTVWANYYCEADYRGAKAGEYVETVSYESANYSCNEGPAVVKHDGKYWLTFSVNSYVDSSYQVVQAVADSPLGPFRKLTEAEGAVLISGSTSGSQEVSGTGHHSFVTVGDQLFIVYHKHDDPVAAGAARHHCIDEIKWISVTDINGETMEVMYTNGPTCTPQPKVEAYAEYVNIADEATVSGSDDAFYLTDGLLSVYKYANAEFIDHIRETVITETTTFTFDFDQARTVRAIMVYNSKLEDTCFMKISEVEFICEEADGEVRRYIEEIPFSPEYYMQNDLNGSAYYVTPGAAAYAEFAELNVKSVRITVEVPEGQASVGISEVRILGK